MIISCKNISIFLLDGCMYVIHITNVTNLMRKLSQSGNIASGAQEHLLRVINIFELIDGSHMDIINHEHRTRNLLINVVNRKIQVDGLFSKTSTF